MAADDFEYYETTEQQNADGSDPPPVEPPREAGRGWTFVESFHSGRLVIFRWRRPNAVRG